MSFAESPLAVAPPLAEEIFRAFTDRLATRTADVARLVASGFSFEEWLNWEFFLACQGRPGWDVTPRPSYVALGAKSPAHGDLLVRDAATQRVVLVETGLVHDYSGGERWANELAADAEKLRTAFPQHVIAMQVIVCASAVDIATDEAWGGWLSKVPAWNRADALECAVALPPAGSMIARGWA